MRILGIDTSLRSTGVGLVEASGNRLRALAYGTLKTAAKAPHTTCLNTIHAGITELIAEHRPQAAAIEGVFFSKNVKTAVILGEARGAALAACAARGLPVFEYAPRRVKQALVGYGQATKEQVRGMVVRLLALREEPQEDAGDALALAVCHAQSSGQPTGREAKEI